MADARVIRVTDASDGPLINRLYSYWSNTVVISDLAFVFVGHADGHPRFFQVNLKTGAVARLGSLLPYVSEAEGWSWDINGFIYLIDGPRLRKVNPFPGNEDWDEVVLDISTTHPGLDLWQSHSSDDGTTHCATVREVVSEGAYPKISTVVSSHGHLQFYGAHGVLDESQITPDGRFLIIKEDDDNRIITIGNGEERRLSDAEGAVGHSDTGPDILVGEDNQIGACVLWHLPTLTKRVLFHTNNMGYVSIRAGRCLHSGDAWLNLVDLETGALAPLIEHGGGSAYDDRVKANLSPCGRVATFMSGGVVSLLVLP